MPSLDEFLLQVEKLAVQFNVTESTYDLELIGEHGTPSNDLHAKWLERQMTYRIKLFINIWNSYAKWPTRHLKHATFGL